MKMTTTNTAAPTMTVSAKEKVPHELAGSRPPAVGRTEGLTSVTHPAPGQWEISSFLSPTTLTRKEFVKPQCLRWIDSGATVKGLPNSGHCLEKTHVAGNKRKRLTMSLSLLAVTMEEEDGEGEEGVQDTGEAVKWRPGAGGFGNASQRTRLSIREEAGGAEAPLDTKAWHWDRESEGCGEVTRQCGPQGWRATSCQWQQQEGERESVSTFQDLVSEELASGSCSPWVLSTCPVTPEGHAQALSVSARPNTRAMSGLRVCVLVCGHSHCGVQKPVTAC